MPGIEHTDESDAPEGARTASEQAGTLPSAPLTQAQIQATHPAGLVPLAGPILLVDYDPAWPGLFAREARRVQEALGERILLLEHVGSTSVPELAAKPRIDMLLVVADSADEQAYVPVLEAAGYVLQVREPDWFSIVCARGRRQTSISTSSLWAARR
ncbi:MAG TPA: GrpB family protein [Ktedonobacteraceae bacterium]|jgi:GrpB-like predicted nucleotidyltransferase (UPF0157 family)